MKVFVAGSRGFIGQALRSVLHRYGLKGNAAILTQVGPDKKTVAMISRGIGVDVPELWRRSHIAVLPSYYREGIPRSLLEAAACGRAIVTTDMPGCREIVRNGHNGLLVPPRDSVAIADAIERLLDDAEMRQRMGMAGHELVKNEFAEEHVVAQTLSVYRKLLDERERAD